jgi:arylsulfatase A-like enzyme
MKAHGSGSGALRLFRMLLGIAGLTISIAADNPKAALAPRGEQARTHLVIVVDGLRPDYVTPELMPRLSQLGQRGMVFNAHHAVFPTVTRVNASSFVTGAYPETHGLMGNTVFFPTVDRQRVFNTGSRENLAAIQAAVGQLLTAPSLGEILEQAGRKLLVVSSGTSGSAFLLNHASGHNALIHPEFTRPPELEQKIVAQLGPSPAHAIPNDAQNARAVDAYLGFGLNEFRPDVTFMWLSDPDSTAHERGVGVELTQQALRLVDAQIGRVEDGLRAKGLLDQTNLIVTSDHGFSTHTRELNLASLVEPFAKVVEGVRDIVTAEGAIYIRNSDQSRVAAIVRELQARPEVGAIFTRPFPGGGVKGVVPGTLSFDVARWNHARAGDILISANWTSARNAAGYAGTTTQKGTAGHGTSSPYDIHNTLIAVGPDFREHAVSAAPTGNVDIAPTVLRLVGVSIPATMSGRVIEEGFRTGPSPASIQTSHTTETAETPDGAYVLSVHFSSAAGHRYMDFTEVKRR